MSACSATDAENAPAAEVHVISVSLGITPESNQSSIPADGSCTHLTDAGNSDGKVSGEPAQIRASAVSIGLIRPPPRSTALSSSASGTGPIATRGEVSVAMTRRYAGTSTSG